MMKVIISLMLVMLNLGKIIPFANTNQLVSDMVCLKQTYSKIVFRGYDSVGSVDPYVIRNLQRAKAANLTAEVYMNPSPWYSPVDQASKLMKAIANLSVGRVWISVVYSWNQKIQENIAFLKALVIALKSNGAKVGILTNEPTWVKLMGKSCSDFSELPLWYTNYNKKPDNSDFKPFGGWKTPQAKQYGVSIKICGAIMSLDSYYS